MTRMLVKIIGMDEIFSKVFLTIPVLDFTKLVKLDYRDFPEDVLQVILNGKPYLHAEVGEIEGELHFDCWEIE